MFKEYEMLFFRAVLILLIATNLMAMSDKEAGALMSLKVDTQKLTRVILLISMDYDYDKNKAKLKKFSKDLTKQVESSKSAWAKKIWAFYKEPINMTLNDDINTEMLDKLDKANMNLYRVFRSLDRKINRKKFKKQNLITNQIMISEQIANNFIYVYRDFKSMKALSVIDQLLRKYDKNKDDINETMASKKWEEIKPKLRNVWELRDLEIFTVIKLCETLSDSATKNSISSKMEQNLTGIDNNQTIEGNLTDINKTAVQLPQMINKDINETSIDKNGTKVIKDLNKTVIIKIDKIKPKVKDNLQHGYYINLLSQQINYLQQINKHLLLLSLKKDRYRHQQAVLKLSSKFVKTLKRLKKKDIFKNLRRIKNRWLVLNSKIRMKLRGNEKILSSIIRNSNSLSKLISKSIYEYQDRHFELKIKEALMVQRVILAGEIRSLTQKMTTQKFMILANFQSDKSKKELKKSINRFNLILNGFQKGDKSLNLKAIKDEFSLKNLIKIEKMWNRLKSFYEKEKFGDKEFNIILKENEDFMYLIDDIVITFETQIDY